MSPFDLRVLCSALGFTAVVIQGGTVPKKEGAAHAAAFAHLIEAFCLEIVPDTFSQPTEFSSGAGVRDRMVEVILETIKATGSCTQKELLLKGFTPVEIEKHWRMSYAIAKVQMNILDS